MFLHTFAHHLQRSMYNTLLYLHGITRWILLAATILSLYKAWDGYSNKRLFSKADNSIRHWTATASHIQLILGIILYIKSPIIQYFWHNKAAALSNKETTFFALAHSTLMLAAIVLITIGSATAKRKDANMDKHKTILWWYGIALLIIIIAIPWPFSPFAMRPLFR